MILLSNTEFFIFFVFNVVSYTFTLIFRLVIFYTKQSYVLQCRPQIQCIFKNEGFCSNTFISFHELRHERFSSTVFPDAQSCIEIMLLKSDLFYQSAIHLPKTSVCTKHKDDLLKEFRRSKCRKCSVCVPCFGKSTASATVQNIAALIALTSYEQPKFQHSYGKLICCRCREEVAKRIDSARQIAFVCNTSNNVFF